MNFKHEHPVNAPKSYRLIKIIYSVSLNSMSILFLQGCESEISSMVTEAQRKMCRSTDAALSATAHLAAITGTRLHLTEHGSDTVGKVRFCLICLQLD